MSKPKHRATAEGDPLPLPLSELDKALKGITGTDKAEVDREERKEQRRKANSKGKKPKGS